MIMLRLTIILFSWDPELGELTLALAALLWGLWLALPLNVFRTAPQFYSAMATLAPERAWGLILIAIGALQAFALYRFTCCVIDSCSDALFVFYFRLRRTAAFLAGVAWFTILVFLSVAQWRAPGVPVYITLSLLGFIVYGRLCTIGPVAPASPAIPIPSPSPAIPSPSPAIPGEEI